MVVAISVVRKGRAPLTYLFDAQELTLGRSSSNDLVFDLPSDGMVSRRHVQLTWNEEQDSWRLRDLESTQGTYVNRQRIIGEVALEDGDEVQLGLKGPMLTAYWLRRNGTGPSAERSTSLPQLPSISLFPLAFYGDFPKRYNLYEKIGEGGYGQVWRARCRGNQGWVAVKFLRPELLLINSNASEVRIRQLERRFRREAELNQRLAAEPSTSVAKVHEVGGDPAQGFLYMILDYIEGPSLDQLIPRYPAGMDLHSSVRYVKQVSQTLEHAHSMTWRQDDTDSGEERILRGIIHRDIKPSNILIRRSDDRAILCDFGIAAIAEGAERLTLPRMQVFSHKYTAPEVLVQNHLSISTDLWGLAVTFYVMLSGGHYPYPGASLRETLEAIRGGEITPLTAHRPDAPEPVVDFLNRALHRDPARRFQTAGDWVAAMEAFQELSAH